MRMFIAPYIIEGRDPLEVLVDGEWQSLREHIKLKIAGVKFCCKACRECLESDSCGFGGLIGHLFHLSRQREYLNVLHSYTVNGFTQQVPGLKSIDMVGKIPDSKHPEFRPGTHIGMLETSTMLMA